MPLLSLFRGDVNIWLVTVLVAPVIILWQTRGQEVEVSAGWVLLVRTVPWIGYVVYHNLPAFSLLSHCWLLSHLCVSMVVSVCTFGLLLGCILIKLTWLLKLLRLSHIIAMVGSHLHPLPRVELTITQEWMHIVQEPFFSILCRQIRRRWYRRISFDETAIESPSTNIQQPLSFLLLILRCRFNPIHRRYLKLLL